MIVKYVGLHHHPGGKYSFIAEWRRLTTRRRGPVMSTSTQKVCGNLVVFTSSRNSPRCAAAASTAWHRPSVLVEDTWSDCLQPSTGPSPWDCSGRADCVTQHCRRSSELSSSPGCCTLPASRRSPRPQTGSGLRDAPWCACRLPRAVRTSRPTAAKL